MGRFDRIHTPRLQVEVNLPNYDLRKSVAAAARREERNRKKRNRQVTSSDTAQAGRDDEPIHLGGDGQQAAVPQLGAQRQTTVEIEL
jgi:hypothetical protein